MTRRAAGAIALLALCGCGGGNTAPTPVESPPTAASPRPLEVPPQTALFVVELQQAGATARAAEIRLPKASFPWIDVPAVRIDVEDHYVWAFEYPTTAEAEAVARDTSASGHRFAGAQVSWVSDPHIFRSDRLIVLYVGRSRPILDVLERVLGPQFAGL